MEKVITRFAPSPTGYLHLGGARTALFNWLHARHTNGTFVLRIEDTDAVRSTKESVDAIFKSLEWLGIDWDEGPFFQTERYDIYKKYIEKLINSDNAYYCTCSAEDVDKMRKEAMASGANPKYNGNCREKGLKKTDNAVVRFKSPVMGTTVIEDIIKGSIVFQNTELDDFIIQRGDGSPTYNMAVVIDDLTMEINTVIRGDDHINNTHKQIQLYKALDANLPVFGHVPMVLGKDKARLSKRHGAMSVGEYSKMGILPDAMLNYLVRLGWSHGDQEFFTRDELIEKFTLKNIGKSAGVFDTDKLLALNGDHIKSAKTSVLVKSLLPLLKERGCDDVNIDILEKAIETLRPRSKTLLEMADGSVFYFTDEFQYDEKAAKKFLKPALIDPVEQITAQLKQLELFDEKSLENVFAKVMETTGLKFGKIAQPVRVALTGKTVSPGIFEMIWALGKEKTITRLESVILFMKKKETQL